MMFRKSEICNAIAIGAALLALFLPATAPTVTPRPREPNGEPNQERGGDQIFASRLSPLSGVPQDYYTYFDIPDLSLREMKNNFCKRTKSEWETYYQQQNREAKALSDRLEAYIKDWYHGRASPRIPSGLLPSSIDNEKTKDWVLLKPKDIRPEDQWYVFPAHEIDPDFKKLYQHSVDGHATYLRLVFISPFDSQLLIDGDFPHSREMSYHIIRPFDPKFPGTGNMGVLEVPIIDVDIEPDLGHINPFRTGGDRKASNRHYHLVFDLKAGDPTALNPVLQDAHLRAPGNVRVGGPFISTGPYGNGVIIPSTIWLRYYAPDKGLEPLAGVPLPNAILKLKTGEEFWLKPSNNLAKERQTMPAEGATTPPRDPTETTHTLNGSDVGWFKMFGIWELFAEARAIITTAQSPERLVRLAKQEVRQMLDCFFNQGPDNPSPGNIAHSATDCPYHDYLIRNFWLGPNKVYVITGKLPTTPRTRNGETTLGKAQARYWSISHTGSGKDRKYQGVLYGTLMDDEIVTNANNEYVIVYSTAVNRPKNANPENGVTWQDFGPESGQNFQIRWMSVYPDHYMEEYAPTDQNIPWETGAWMQNEYDKTLVSENRPGVMGPYHPVIHYLTKKEFEALGDRRLSPKDIPTWTASSEGEGGSGRGEDLQDKLEELRRAFNDLSRARQAGNRQGIAVASRRIRAIWDDLPPRARQEIEKKWPGISEKIAKIR